MGVGQGGRGTEEEYLAVACGGGGGRVNVISSKWNGSSIDREDTVRMEMGNFFFRWAYLQLTVRRFVPYDAPSDKPFE